jgi:general stress protein YciG
MARVLGRRGGTARSRVLSREERREIAAKGGRARALSHHAERRVRENFRALEAVDALRHGR